MNKNGWIICAIIFVFVTTFVLSLDNPSVKRVKFSNRDIKLGHEATEISNNKSSVKINLEKSNIDNTKISTTNTGFDITSSTDITDSDVSFTSANVDYNNQVSGISSENNLRYKNLDDSHLDNALEEARNIDESRRNPQRKESRYMYKNIDWSTWHSNFVNRILDDSISIRELDNYSEGAWFSYSFDVDETGRISNISVFSMFLLPEDKDRIVSLIKGYQYKDITVFPANTKRKTAKVSAVMLLSDSTKKANPSDFKDTERIKIKYGN